MLGEVDLLVGRFEGFLPVTVPGVWSMTDVGGDRNVALAGQSFAHAKQLPALALRHDDAARGRRAIRASDKQGVGRLVGPTGMHLQMRSTVWGAWWARACFVEYQLA